MNSHQRDKLFKRVVSGPKLLISVLRRICYGLINCITVPGRIIKRHPYYLICAVVVLNFLISILNPFNIENTTDQHFANLFNTLSSPFYGGLDRPAQENIIVVLVQQSSMESFGISHWPIPYKGQAALIEKIAEYHPKAIFLDFYYGVPQRAPGTDPKFEIDETSNIIRAINGDDRDEVSRKDIKDFAATLKEKSNEPTEEQPPRPYLPILLGPIGDDPALAPLRQYADSKVLIDRLDVGISVHKDITIRYPAKDADGRPQAAYALYNIICLLDSPFSKKVRRHCADFEKYGLAEKDLSVEWGLGSLNQHVYLNEERRKQAEGIFSPESQGIVVKMSCSGRTLWARFTTAMKLFLNALFSGSSDSYGSARSECAYHDFIPAEYLFDVIDDDDLRELLEDKVVLVGADIDYLADSFENPIYGSQPGVMVHAMALDNIIERGTKTHRLPRPILGGADLADLITGILLSISSLVIIAIHQHSMSTGQYSRKERLANYGVVIIIFSAVGVFIGRFLMHWPPGHIFEMGITLFGLFTLLEILTSGSYDNAQDDDGRV